MRKRIRSFAVFLGAGLFLSAGALPALAADSGNSAGGWIFAWAEGTASAATCNTNQTCISGSGKGLSKSLFGVPAGSGEESHAGGNGALGRYDFAANLTLDSGNASPNGFGGTCSAAGGTLTLSHRSDSLVVDVQGAACALGASATLSALNGSYVVDGAHSAGAFAGASGTGAFNAALDANATPIALSLVLNGNLQP